MITLKEKGVDFDVIYIDLADKPDWFLKLSPLGKVPVLKVEREGREPAVVFESAVIVEYLEETAPGKKLHPSDPLEKARHRAWIEVVSQLLGDLYALSRATTEEKLEAARDKARAKLERLDDEIAGPFFGGEALGYVDIALAPAFRQLDLLDGLSGADSTAGLPKVGALRKALAARESVQHAVPEDYAERFLDMLRKQDAQVLKAA